MTQKSEADEREALMAEAAQIAYAAYSADYDAEPEIRALVDRALLARVAAPAVQPQEPVAWRFAHNRGHGRVAYTYHDNEPSNDYRTAYRDTCVEVAPLYAAPQAEARQEQLDSSYPAQPTGDAATARDAALADGLRQVRSTLVWAADYVGGWDSLGKHHPLRVSLAIVDAALSSTPAQGDNGATGADLPDGAQR